MSSSKLTVSIKRAITQDWQTLFPEFGVFKPMHLLRRVGPVVIGIYLDPVYGYEAYKPTSHLHNLANRFAAMTLSLSQRLLVTRSGTDDAIPVKFHELHFHEAADRLQRQAFVPLTGEVRLDKLLQAYRQYMRSANSDAKYPLRQWEDMISLLAWAGTDGTTIEVHLKEVRELVRTWPEQILIRDGGATAWLEKLRAIGSSIEMARKTVGEEIDRFKLRKIPSTELLP